MPMPPVVMTLLGAGLSNRDIATRLTLSVRTVEGHIHHAMAKTGTTCREDLAALLPRRHVDRESFLADGHAPDVDGG